MLFTFIVDFRGGTYCSQVEAIDLISSLPVWIEEITKQQKEIKHLGAKVLEELKNEINNPDLKPIGLTGLKNIWYAGYSTCKGSFRVNIVLTAIS